MRLNLAGILTVLCGHFLRDAVHCLSGDHRELRLWHPKYPPVIWFPEFPMFSNRTNPARIVVQMHDSLDFFCPDYINSQYQSFTGAKKLPSDYGAEEIYMVDGQDYQSCFAGLSRGRLPKKHARLLLRCPGKTADTKTKAKFQYTVSFRMFSPVPKGPEFNCNQEYYFLGIFPGHNHDEEAIEKALCSTSALRLQIFVSCTDSSPHNLYAFPSPNVIQLDRPAQSSDLLTTTASSLSSLKSAASTVHYAIYTSDQDTTETPSRPISNSKSRSGSRSTTAPASGGLYVARSDRKIMRNDSPNSSGSDGNGGNGGSGGDKRSSRRMQPSGSTRSPALKTLPPDTPDDIGQLNLDFDGVRDMVTTPSSTEAKSTARSKPSSKQQSTLHSTTSSAAAACCHRNCHFLSMIFSLWLIWSFWNFGWR